ncbi:MAG TPA: MerR family transcriptional regulator [Trueperaceae bacterium]|nr:MerR family transcriptional regulator [Trueperaceae bacterium]
MAAAVPAPLSSHREAVWNLNQFVDAVNALLPSYLPKDATGRTTDEVNARLVRHYATQGLIEEARREGREARYLYDHLIQLLVVRKLLAEGFSTTATKQAMTGRSAEELTRLLEGEVRVELVPEPATPGTAARAEFLRQVRARAGLDTTARLAPTAGPGPTARPGPGASPLPPAAIAPTGIFSESVWTRLSILDGLDLFVRDDFELPKNRLGDEQLTQLLRVVLMQLEQRRKGSS